MKGAYATTSRTSKALFSRNAACRTRRILCADFYRHFHHNRSTNITRVCATALPGSKLHLDTWLLGMGTRRLLLGAWDLGISSSTWLLMDTWLLGLWT